MNFNKNPSGGIYDIVW